MAFDEKFASILTRDAPLAPLTSLKLGGAAQFLARPGDVRQLGELLSSAKKSGVPTRVLGGGSNILVPDDGCQGLVILLDQAPFQQIRVEGNTVICGGGATLSEVIAHACQAGLSGLETLVGIPGSVAGAVVRNAGGRAGDIGQFIQSIRILDADGQIESRPRNAIRFGYRTTDLDDTIVVEVTLQLTPDEPDSIVRRLKKIWIEKQAHQPFNFQRTAFAFRNPRGLSAAEMIEKAGVRSTKVGGAELSDRDPRYVVVGETATSRDVRQLIELVVARVEEQTGVRLELQIDIW